MGIAYLETLGMTSGQGTTITANASANTKGSWTSVGTTAGAAVFVEVRVHAGAQATSYLVDFGVDTAGGTSYTTAIGNILLSAPDSSTGLQGDGLMINSIVPMWITLPSGTRCAFRCQASTGSATCDADVRLYSGTSIGAMTFVGSFGANTADSGGVTVTSGGTWSKGSWTQLSSSIGGAVNVLVPIVQNTAATTALANRGFLVDIGTGAASSEVVKIGDIPCFTGTLEPGPAVNGNISWLIDVSSGTRIAARSAYPDGATDFEMVVLGFSQTISGGGGGGTTGRQGLHAIESGGV